jgi:predicted transcriptional regulator of viral defense system
MPIESTSSPSLPVSRQRLTEVLRAASDVFTVDDAAGVLGVDRSAAAKTLARWTRQGWLRRVGHGAYVSASLDLLDSNLVLEDPWVLVPALYAPAYIGGRTAAHHWDLTEQLFNDVVVLTTRPIREKSQERQGARFSLKHVASEKLFGTTPLWRGQTKIAISDVHRTVVDILDDPDLGGGIDHVAQCLNAYLRRDDRNDKRLLDYADRLGNGAVFKRLGFLAERDANGSALVEQCRARLTKGNAKLDPSTTSPRLLARWRLWLPRRSA